MSRLAATMLCDVRLQLRHGFYYATAVVVIGSIVLLRWLSEEAVALLFPLVVIQNVMTNSFYFVGGLTLLENVEGTRAAQAVTPLRTGESIASKVITLGVLSVVESGIIAACVLGLAPALLPLGLGIALASVLLTLAGIAVVARYEAINEYLLPSVLYTLLLSLPVFGWLGIGPPALYAWHPLDGPIRLMGAWAEPPGAAGLLWCVLWPAAWIPPAYLWSRRALRRTVRT